MICPNLIGIANLSERALLIGAKMDELNVRPECQLSRSALELIHNGQEVCIEHMLQGGNGFPYVALGSTQFELGCSQERRDLAQFQDWDLDLTLCQRERKFTHK